MRTLLLALGLALAAGAHTLQITGVSLHLDAAGTGVKVVAHVPMFNGADPAREIPRRLRLALDGEAFQPAQVSLRRDPQHDTVTWMARQARRPRQAELRSPIFPDHPEDTTIVLVYRDGELIEKTALNPAHPAAVVGESRLAVIQRFGEMGIVHILSGADHILFLCGLILAGGPVLRTFAVVTAFTLAHALTVSLTALGISSLSPRFVEPMIALSVIVVGLENLWRSGRSFEFRAWLAFGFGFFHGFGFAGALTEAGLPGHALAWSLAAFNLGVEAGQAIILALVLPLLALSSRLRITGLVTRYASLAIAVAGAIWFGQRIWT